MHLLTALASALLFTSLVFGTAPLLDAIGRRLDAVGHRLDEQQPPRLEPCTVLCRSFLVLENRPPYAFAVALVGWAPRNGSCKSLGSGSPSS